MSSSINLGEAQLQLGTLLAEDSKNNHSFPTYSIYKFIVVLVCRMDFEPVNLSFL